MQGFRNPTPPSYNRTLRMERGRGITTGPAAKIMPLRFIPTFREESISGMRVTVSAELGETVRPIQNAVEAEFQAVFVPYAAFPRFKDLGDFNRSYAKVKNPHTNAVDPFIQTAAFDATSPFWKALGVHMVAGEQVNVAPIEAYNVWVNYLYNDRSPNLASRTALDNTLATAFWLQNKFGHVKPDYDRSLINGVVPIQAPAAIPVKGLGLSTMGSAPTSNTQVQTGQNSASVVSYLGDPAATGGADGRAKLWIEKASASAAPNIRVDVNGMGLNISLADIELAKQQAAFAQLRKKLSGHDDEEIIKLIMQGIRVPEYMERQPMLLASKRVPFSFGTRFATSGDLTDSVTNGLASAQLSINLPRTNTGGIILVTATVVPDQLFERRRDSFLAMTDQAQWPEVERDTLDVDKVDQVLCKDVEITHNTPNSLFGYEPMNFRHHRDYVRLGGHLYRPTAATVWDEDRAGVWVTEPVNPTLSADWYLAKSVNLDPFADRNRDPVTYTVAHDGMIEGLTVFGPELLEIAPAV
nr:MAG: major capsid protein [Microvirus sp.]